MCVDEGDTRVELGAPATTQHVDRAGAACLRRAPFTTRHAIKPAHLNVEGRDPDAGIEHARRRLEGETQAAPGVIGKCAVIFTAGT